jgi:type II secretory pathway pseudopilin PulG
VTRTPDSFFQTRRCRKALSLFELLVVFLIATVLAGLAFMGSMNILHRAKHQRVLEEHRIISRALQNYKLDHGDVPAPQQGLLPLLRPTVYLGSVPKDPFQAVPDATYLYLVPNTRDIAAVLISPGPDGKFNLPEELWDFAGTEFVDEHLVPPMVRARVTQRRIGSFRPDNPEYPGTATPITDGESNRPVPATMSESQVAILMTYIRLAQYSPDSGTDGDIITVAYF